MKVDVEMSPFQVIAESPIERVIEDLVYEHLVDLVDFDRMYELEQIVEQRLGDLVERGELPAADEADLAERAAAIVAGAWHRLIADPRRYVDFKGDWRPDDDCELCRALAASRRESKS